MTSFPPIVIASEDRARLERLIERTETDAAEQLETELERARVLPRHEVPADVVVMNSEVEYEDTATGHRRKVQLVYPPDADGALGRVSVLAPLGCALVGLRVGQEIDWRMPGGLRRLRVVQVKPPAEFEPATQH